MSDRVKTNDILDALKSYNTENIWATELGFFGGLRRIDFWTLAPIMSKGFRTSAYEIKASRSDFKRDTEDKQSGALLYSDRFWYVTPPGLLTKSDLPPWAGLQEWNGKTFKVIKRAPKREKVDPDWQMVVSILRNSGDVRRDVDLLKQQLGFLMQFKTRTEKNEQAASKRKFERWKNQNTPKLKLPRAR